MGNTDIKREVGRVVQAAPSHSGHSRTRQVSRHVGETLSDIPRMIDSHMRILVVPLGAEELLSLSNQPTEL